jgi:hypothetical protein
VIRMSINYELFVGGVREHTYGKAHRRPSYRRTVLVREFP